MVSPVLITIRTSSSLMLRWYIRWIAWTLKTSRSKPHPHSFQHRQQSYNESWVRERQENHHRPGGKRPVFVPVPGGTSTFREFSKRRNDYFFRPSRRL